MVETHYSVLGVPPTATADEIAAQFRAKAERMAHQGRFSWHQTPTQRRHASRRRLILQLPWILIGIVIGLIRIALR